MDNSFLHTAWLLEVQPFWKLCCGKGNVFQSSGWSLIPCGASIWPWNGAFMGFGRHEHSPTTIQQWMHQWILSLRGQSLWARGKPSHNTQSTWPSALWSVDLEGTHSPLSGSPTTCVCLTGRTHLITWQCEWSKTTPTHVLNVLGATCGTPVSLIGGSLMSTDAEKDLWVTEPGSLVWRPVFLWFWLACYQCYLSWSSKSYISFSAAKEKLKERLKRELWVRPNTYHKGWLITLENV